MRVKFTYTHAHETTIEGETMQECRNKFYTSHPQAIIIQTDIKDRRKSVRDDVIALAFSGCGYTQRQIAEMVGCSPTTVSNYVTDWCHEKGISLKRDLMARDPGYDASTPQH